MSQTTAVLAAIAVFIAVSAALLGAMVPLLNALSERGAERGRAGAAAGLLTDPFLQLPTATGVRVAWLTGFEGREHAVILGDGRRFPATTTRMSRLAEDARSHVGTQAGDGSLYPRPTPRPVWRHEARVSGIAGRVSYRVESVAADGTRHESGRFTLAPRPAPGAPLSILLTSDHQLGRMVPANLQKVEETVGRVDAVFFAGDLQNVPDRASEWIDDARGSAFFPALQGRARRALPADGAEPVIYRGGEILQHAPLFPVIGNHEVMGRRREGAGLDAMFADPRPRHAAEAAHAAHAALFNPRGDAEVRADWIRDNSFNTVTYRELFSLPAGSPGGEGYYSLRFGDVHLVGLNAARIWRTPSMAPGARGKYRERAADLDTPHDWGGGEFIFEDMSRGSAQHDWLRGVLASAAFRTAPVKVVMLHHPVHGVGDNSVPVFAHPERILERDARGRLTGVRYAYPIDRDIFVRDVEPLLAEAGVDLVLTGHSHLWARMESPRGLRFLETSNVGRTFGCYLDGHAERRTVPGDPRFDPRHYPATGDPHGYEPVMPSGFAPMRGAGGDPLPCVASDRMTVFSILETGAGGARVDSYVFDTLSPEDGVRLFDSFPLE